MTFTLVPSEHVLPVHPSRHEQVLGEEHVPPLRHSLEHTARKQFHMKINQGGFCDKPRHNAHIAI